MRSLLACSIGAQRHWGRGSLSLEQGAGESQGPGGMRRWDGPSQAAMLTTKSHVTSSPSPAASYPVSCPGPSCPDSWIGYRGKCYYFSEMEGNWTYSQSQCSALNSSLAVIDSEQDLIFMLRFKVRTDPWIGLRREPGQGWKWPNGLEFNNLFVIRGESDCTFLSEDTVSSSRCYIERNWICSKPDAYAKGTDMRGDSRV
uniref:C-type lectin domain-containing protein n=1 Tax=Terrapene triunguis TaxID=2587831 RepID=A0A674IHK8_9SAUR